MNSHILTAAILVASSISFHAQPDSPSEQRLARKTLWMRVVDPDGKPVTAAKVKPWALRFGNAHGSWRAERNGEPQQTVTDENGGTPVDYPPAIGGEDVKTVSVLIDHPDYCVKNIEVPISGTKDAPALVTLERGTPLRLQAVDAGTLEPIADPHIQFLSYEAVRPLDGGGHFRKADGEAGKSGWYQSRRLPREASRLYVVSIRDDDVPMFSRLFRWSPEDPLSHLIIASVDTGVRFEGMIDPAVPRPIRKGRVVGCATVPPDDSNQRGSTIWTDIVPVNDDGSFVFQSMPRDCDLQIVSLCEGWRSDLPTPEDATRMVERYGGQIRTSLTFSAPQSWMLDNDVVSGTVRMIRTASCRVRCLKPDGTPAAGVIVGFSPNHFFHGGGSQIFAVSYRSADMLKGRPFERLQQYQEYLGTTDADGWATIANLPAGPISFDIVDHRVAGATRERGETITVELGKVAETTVKIEPLPN